MKKILGIVFLLPALSLAGQGLDESEIRFTAEQFHNLQLTTEALEKAERIPVVSAPAMVVVPPSRELVVTEPNGGLVKQIFVSEGESVEQDQKLVEIVSSGMLGLQRDLLIDQSNYELVQRQYQREKSLFDQGVIAEKRLQEAEMKFQQARITRDEARQVLRIAGFSDRELDALIRTKNLTRSKIVTAPTAGVILQKFVGTGQRVADRDPLFSIADLSVLWLEAAVPQVSVEQVELGDSMEIGKAGAVGRITLIDSKVDKKHQSVMVRAVVDHPDRSVRPGRSVQVTVRAERRDLFTAPKSSLVRHEGKTLVFVRSANGFIPRVVDLLGETDDQVIIHGDLSGEDQVAVQGTIAIKAHWLGFGGGE